MYNLETPYFVQTPTDAIPFRKRYAKTKRENSDVPLDQTFTIHFLILDSAPFTTA